MNNTVPVMEKRDFLKWFLDQYQLKRRECAWLLNFLMSDDILMERVHFVEQADYCPKALMISTSDVECVPFAFHKNQHVTMDAEKSFHDIRLNRNEDIFIQLNFKDKHLTPQYVAVLEENPYLPVNEEETNVHQLMAEMILERSIRTERMKRIEKEIDAALAAGDKSDFYRLSDEYNELKALNDV
ncbi:ReoY family proteolytic degradation factor [Alteribacter natronophilus]|uniref:ReoY family proteolytic degradation factor n=1 Tax=Alteribacter natronophilus TaxID=2583810 RepID=UPI00110E499E|nr:ReoY family proteolytic degradation factor [Alteribacter natronophilus]TMW73584.1 YpiB family protein [Alteribacter natronophilus]